MMTGHIFLFEALRFIPGPNPDGALMPIRSAKLRPLLAFLLLHRDQPVRRETISQLLWPKATPTAARRNLREYLYRARQFLQRFAPDNEWLISDERYIYFRPDDNCWIDVVHFESLLTTLPQGEAGVHQRHRAIELYQGDLLATTYDEWVDAPRRQLRQLFLNALTELADIYQQQSNYADAIQTAQTLLTHDPLDEATYRRLMQLHVAIGDRATALNYYQIGRDQLRQQLDVPPMEETIALYEAISAGSYQFTPAEILAPIRGNRPVSPIEHPPFIGRQKELAQLQAALDKPTPQMMVISGDSGLGKTRLVTEWLRSLPSNVIQLTGRGHEFEQAVPYRPVLDAIQQAVQRLKWDQLPPSTTHTWLAPLAQLLPDLYFYFPDLPSAPDAADTEVGHHVTEGIAQLLINLARQAPTILFLDDLHWADMPTWQFLSYATRRLRTVPILIIATFSTSEAADEQRRRLRQLSKHGDVGDILLSQLWPDELTRLVTAVLQREDADTMQLAAQLYEITQGNPFYVVEWLRSLSDNETVPPTSASALPLRAIPNAVQALIENRLDRLSENSSQLLSMAAAIRRPFTLDLLRQMAQLEEEQLLTHIDEWLTRSLVVEQAAELYDFGHQQLREVAYQRLSGPRRRRVHRTIAETLSRQEPVSHERVAHHFGLSDRPVAAIPYLLTAGRGALELRSYHSAEQIGQDMLTLLQKIPDAASIEERLELNLQLALATCFTGETKDALPILNAAAQLAEATQSDALAGEAALRIAQIYWLQGNPRRANEMALAAVDRIDNQAKRDQAAAAQRLLGRIAVAQGNHLVAMDHLEASLQLITVKDNPLNGIATQGYMAVALGYLGEQEAMAQTLNDAVGLATWLNSPAVLAVIRIQGSVGYVALENWIAADALARQGIEAAKRLNMPVYTFVANCVLGRTAYFLGNPTQAYETLREAIVWAEANDYLLFRHLAHLYLAEIALLANDLETVRSQSMIGLSLAEQTNNQWSRKRFSAILAEME